MCVSPIRIPNKSRRISVNSFVQSHYLVPCGHCCECRSLKQMEWLFRLENEFKRCVSSGGSVLFDTLTYRESDVPRISRYEDSLRWQYTFLDRYCFDSKDCQDFFKRLRHKSDFRYFLVSEYGTHPFYTHRPHYHVLFFLPSGVDPLLFSEYVSDCWRFGRTDGVKYKGSLYVYNKRVYRERTPQIMNIIKYVSKYVVKSFVEDGKLRDRIDKVCSFIYGDDYRKKLTTLMHYESLLRRCSEFHLQSLRFGDVNDLEKDKAIAQDCFLTVTDKGPSSLPLFRSFRRRWFYEKKCWNGFDYWQPTIEGVSYLMKRFDKIVKNNALRFEAAICSSDVVCSQFENLGVSTVELSEYFVGTSGRIGKYNGESPRQMYLDSLLPSYDESLFNVSSRYDRWRFGCNGWSYDYVPMCKQSKDIVLDRERFDFVGDVPDYRDRSAFDDFVKSDFKRGTFLSVSCFLNILPYDAFPDVISNPDFDAIIDKVLDLESWYGAIKEKEFKDRKVMNYRMKKAGLTNFTCL